MKSKALYLLVPLGLSVLAGCTTVVEPAPRVAVAPAPTVITTAPVPAVVTTPTLVDSDGDGVPNATDRYPYDAAFR